MTQDTKRTYKVFVSLDDIMEETDEDRSLREAAAKYLEGGALIEDGSDDTIRSCFDEWVGNFEKNGSKILVTVVRAIKDGFFPASRPEERDQSLSGGWAAWWKVVEEFSKKPIVKKKREVCLFHALVRQNFDDTNSNLREKTSTVKSRSCGLV